MKKCQDKTRLSGDVESAAASSCSQVEEGWIKAKTKTLDNGLKVVVVEDHSIARISVGVLYNVGSADDPEHMVGLSHMTEHMFFHGSERFPDIGATLGAEGGTINACTSEDFTLYVTDAPSSALEKICEAEADRMGRFELKNEEIFRKEQMAVFEERLMCVENPPLGLADEYIQASLWPQHPYGKEIIGSRKNIRAYTRNAVNEHYRTWYKPNNATLLVIGDVKGKAVFELAQKYFGWIKEGPLPERVRPQNSLRDHVHHTVTYYSDKVASPKVEFLYTVPHHSTDGMAAEVALKIGLEALFGGRVFSFLKYFEEDKELVSSLNLEWEETYDPYPVSVCAQLMPGVSVERFQKAYNQKLNKVLKRGLAREEFERARRGFLLEAVYRGQDGHSKMRMLLARLAMGYSLEQLESIPSLVKATTYEQVMETLRRVFSPRPFATAFILPPLQS